MATRRGPHRRAALQMKGTSIADHVYAETTALGVTC